MNANQVEFYIKVQLDTNKDTGTHSGACMLPSISDQYPTKDVFTKYHDLRYHVYKRDFQKIFPNQFPSLLSDDDNALGSTIQAITDISTSPVIKPKADVGEEAHKVRTFKTLLHYAKTLPKMLSVNTKVIITIECNDEISILYCYLELLDKRLQLPSNLIINLKNIETNRIDTIIPKANTANLEHQAVAEQVFANLEHQAVAEQVLPKQSVLDTHVNSLKSSINAASYSPKTKQELISKCDLFYAIITHMVKMYQLKPNTDNTSEKDLFKEKILYTIKAFENDMIGLISKDRKVYFFFLQLIEAIRSLVTSLFSPEVSPKIKPNRYQLFNQNNPSLLTLTKEIEQLIASEPTKSNPNPV